MNKSNIKEIIFKNTATFKRNLEALVVVDGNVFALHEKSILSLVEDKKFIYVVEAGEDSKKLTIYGEIIEYFLSLGIHRHFHLYAIGGGVASDLGGYVAATLLRGISWSVVPTTLLSMIDAAIGGKTAINSKYGKNLIGAFHMPSEVLIDMNFLKTLPRSEYQSGMGELLKYSFLDKDISELIKKDEDLHKIVLHCAIYKSDLVERDFKEMGERKHLNFGHTLGHALEKKYKISHGEAVFWGIYLILKVLESELISQFIDISRKLKVEYQNPPWKSSGFDVPSIMQFVSKDKKKMPSDMIEIIGVSNIGHPYIVKKTLRQIEEQLGKFKNEINGFHL